eukprot:jgi/Mesen1/7574/ME000392S06843
MELRSGTIMQPPVPAEQDAQFREGIRVCLSRWTALQLAVENQWGGARSVEKANSMVSDIVTWFYRSRGQKYADELEDMLDESMLQGFNCEIEDGSLHEVAGTMVSLYEACSQGNYEPVRHLQALAAASRPALASSKKVVQEGGDDDDGSEDEADVGMSVGEASSMHAESSMDVERPEGSGSRNPLQQQPAELLSAEEVAQGWEMAPSKGRRGGRGKT